MHTKQNFPTWILKSASQEKSDMSILGADSVRNPHWNFPFKSIGSWKTVLNQRQKLLDADWTWKGADFKNGFCSVSTLKFSPSKKELREHTLKLVLIIPKQVQKGYVWKSSVTYSILPAHIIDRSSQRQMDCSAHNYSYLTLSRNFRPMTDGFWMMRSVF